MPNKASNKAYNAYFIVHHDC